MSGRKEMDDKKEKWISSKLRLCSQLLRDYMLSISETKTSSTRKAYLGYLMQYEQFMMNEGISLTEVKPMHIDRYRKYIIGSGNKKNSASIVNVKLCAIISFYDFLKENDLVDHNPCDSKKKLKVKQKEEVVAMTENEINILKHSIATGRNRRTQKYKNRDLCIVTLGCSTGLRVSAIVNIDIDDIDFEKKTIHVIEKGNKERIICVGENTLQSIRTWMHDRSQLANENEKALFISQKHGRIATRTVEEMMQKETVNIKKHITPHKMRSTCGMRLYEKKHDIYLVQQQLGHANIKNTMIYAKASEDMLREAANILD